MRIAFDGTTLRPYQTGIGYYTEHLLLHLLSEAPEDEFVIVSNCEVTTSLPLPDSVRLFEGYRFAVRNIWMQLLAPLVLEILRPDVAHFTNGIAPLLKRAPTVVTLHDMTLKLFPHLHPRRRLLTRPLVSLAARRAHAIIAVSQTARRDILRVTGVPKARVHLIREAAAPVFRPIHDEDLLEQTRHRYNLAEKFILFVGTIEPRKNLPRLIQAYGMLRKSGFSSHQLVCVGPYGWGYREVRKIIDFLNLEGAVRLTGYAPFEDLPSLYNLSEIFVFPSLHEGFGLPVLEAMACGTPVITARNSSLAEITGGCAEFVDAEDVESIAQALRRLAQDSERRRELAQCALKQAQQFSWQRAARETLAVYRKVSRSASLG
ncbi:glycosyltransferase family 4 protein [Acidobacteria bacterium AH-259-G07]|nr:glycosyltransferase family 4 protein [Acidobacteria bacterium AH-259-G07]